MKFIKKLQLKHWLMIGLISLAVIILSIISFITISSLAPQPGSDESMVFEIESGTSTTTIVSELKEAGLIRSESMMLLRLRLGNHSIQAGNYNLSFGYSLGTVINKLSNGDVIDESLSFLITEGRNVRQIATVIADVTNHSYDEIIAAINDEEFIKAKIEEYFWLTDEILNEALFYPLEGYLFPATYTISSKDEPIHSIIDRMLVRMNREINANLEAIEASDKTVHQILTFASVVELEALHDDTKDKVASVFANRLDRGMDLGSCVTTYYAARINMGDRDLRRSEINMESPFNTRGPNMAGRLPIGPIASPGAASIRAALNPPNTDYLFFVSDKNRQLYFTRTYSEHLATRADLRARGLWLEW